MSNPPNDPFDTSSWKQNPPPNYYQQNPPNYNQQVPPGGFQQIPPGAYQQYPPQSGYQQFPPGGYQPFGSNFAGQIDLPGASNAQVCGIIGIVLFWNIIGIILNIVAIVNGGNAKREYERYPGRFTESSMRQANVGKTCGTVGLCLLGVFIVFFVLVIAVNS